jgi:hypothetical protein
MVCLRLDASPQIRYKTCHAVEDRTYLAGTRPEMCRAFSCPAQAICCSNCSRLRVDSGLQRLNANPMKRLRTASELSCPQCKSRTVYRTKRRGILERIILYPLGFRAYRCEYCNKRFCSRTKATASVEK